MHHPGHHHHESTPDHHQASCYRRAADREDVAYRVAGGWPLRKAAFELVYASYLRRGLVAANPWRLKVTPHHLLPTTQTFVASQRGRVVCCVTLAADDLLGLPMGRTFPDAVAQRRAARVTLAEATCLADDGANAAWSFEILFGVMSLMAQFARRNGVEELLATVHPRHRRFYQRVAGFQWLAAERRCRQVRGHPAVALRLDLARLDRDNPEVYRRFFGDPFPLRCMIPQSMPRDEAEYLSRFLDHDEIESLRILRQSNFGRVRHFGGQSASPWNAPHRRAA